MFYLQYWPILGFKSMNKNKHAFLSNRQKKKKVLNSLSFSPCQGGHALKDTERKAGPGSVGEENKRTRFALQRKI